jgi:uncharacterized membrane protein YhaH (DUF805 family)
MVSSGRMMTWGNYLFSFRGRLNRARYWAFVLVSMLYLVAGLAVALPYILLEHRTTADAGQALSPFGIATIIAECVVVLALFVSLFAVYVKRLHDRNKSAWWLVPFSLIPGIISLLTDPRLPSHLGIPLAAQIALSLISAAFSLWAFIEVGCLRGTIGENRFGKDPLGGQT